MSYDPVIREHQEWLGFLQPVGLVVSPAALKNAQARVARNVIREQEVLLRHTHDAIDENRNETRRLTRFADFAREFWQWEEGDLAVPPDSLSTALQEYGEILRPNYAVPGLTGEPEWQMLIQELPASVAMDQGGHTGNERSWQASPQARFERLLRDTGVPTGLLVNPHAIRLVYAPRGETAGHITFPIQAMCETAGRPIVAALHLLLYEQRLFSAPKDQRLPAILQASRKYQNEVSIQLAGQVLRALNELCRGFNDANRIADSDRQPGELLGTTLKDAPADVYGGLLTTLMRMVFLLYAEDRNLMASAKPGTSDTVETYQRFYGLLGLHEKLREDKAAYPDTMDQRFGAWAQFLTLSRLVHDGGGHGPWRLPARRGRLFDPDVYPFLEGRPYRSKRSSDEKITPPKISDGVLYRVLEDLLYLDGERISYRALDVEQIGSVYEAMMGFEVLQAKAPSIGFRPHHVVINLKSLLAQPAGNRKKWLKKRLRWEPSEKAAQALKSADTADAILAALAGRISPLYTHHERGNLVIYPGDIYLQPTEERRRSGSHYTPRSLTEPIVRTTLDPVLAQLGENPTPEQILNLKVCDPAMGSGAFLVEACRYLGDVLVKTWVAHHKTPDIPTDQDPLLHARRIVAQRCLYGVDKNPFAVDLAKLSLWLATFAKDHPFTFLDHSFRHGDSLVGLSINQMVDALAEEGTLFRGEAERQIANVMQARETLLDQVEQTEYSNLETHYANAIFAAQNLRDLGDLIVAAFFSEEKSKARLDKRNQWINAYETKKLDIVAEAVLALRKRVTPFHWEAEFPEVFRGGGFHSFIGNPPFAGKNTLITSNGKNYIGWLLQAYEQSHGNADLVAYFFRRAFDLLHPDGCMGLIATNTIGQGDTRSTGLRYIRNLGGTIYKATRRLKWPGKAAVVVSVVHISKGAMHRPFELDGRHTELITAYLFHAGGDETPAILRENQETSFQGSTVLGMGFTFDDTDKDGEASTISVMTNLISKDGRNAERIFPYIGGEEINKSPFHSHHRYVINFEDFPLARGIEATSWTKLTQAGKKKHLREGIVPHDYPEPVAYDWPDLLAIVKQKVKPERDTDNRENYRRFWWRFAERRPGLDSRLRQIERVLLISRVTSHVAFCFVSSAIVPAESLVAITETSHAAFAILQSRVHEIWARFFGSSMKDDLRFTPTDCFETFPFPPNWKENDALERAGQEYYQFRADLMVRNNEGLTKTYNRFHDKHEDNADIEKLRNLHAQLDRVALDAYGWVDLQPVHDFILDYEESEEDFVSGKVRKKKKPWRYRWSDDFRDEVLVRLLELNRKRAEEERTNPPKPESSVPVPAKKDPRRRSKTVAKEQISLGLEPSE
ncbi:MAG: N-6 DNA methylase [Bdellovibrionales bacterium]|nr:N-6 DNA methylase [Bdellovibrionales bacterium]